MSGSKKLWYIYTMEYYTAERKKELVPFPSSLYSLLIPGLSFYKAKLIMSLLCLNFHRNKKLLPEDEGKRGEHMG